MTSHAVDTNQSMIANFGCGRWSFWLLKSIFLALSLPLLALGGMYVSLAVVAYRCDEAGQGQSPSH